MSIHIFFQYLFKRIQVINQFNISVWISIGILKGFFFLRSWKTVRHRWPIWPTNGIKLFVYHRQRRTMIKPRPTDSPRRLVVSRVDNYSNRRLWGKVMEGKRSLWYTDKTSKYNGFWFTGNNLLSDIQSLSASSLPHTTGQPQ